MNFLIPGAAMNTKIDLSRALTEPFVSYIEFHEALNRTVKISTAAMLLLKAHVAGDDSCELLSGLFVSSNSLWGPQRVARPQIEVANSLDELSRVLLVSVFSALDTFIVGVRAEQSRWAAFKYKGSASAIATPSHEEEESGQNMETLYREYGWNSVQVAELIPLYNFFRKVRNCVAHRDSKASKSLASEDTATLSVTGRNLVKRRRVVAGTITLPLVKVGKKVALEPQHVIMASSLGYRLAEDVNRKLVSDLGPTGMTHMAAYYTQKRIDHPKRRLDARFAESNVSQFMTGRYRIPHVDGKVAIQLLKAIGIWQTVRNQFDSDMKAQRTKSKATSQRR